MGSKIVKKVVDRLRKVAYAVIEEGVFYYFCFVCPASVPLPLATLTDLVAMKQVSDPGLVNLGDRGSNDTHLSEAGSGLNLPGD